MDNKVKLSQASLIVTVAIIIGLLAAYVPMLGILSLVLPVPYAMIGTLTDNKYSILSVIATFLILMLCVDPIYAVSVCVMGAIPGIVMGNIAKNSIKGQDYNKFDPIYGGTIIFVIAIIVFFVMSNTLFGVNLMEEILTIINEAVNAQIDIIKSTNISAMEGIRASDLVDSVRNMIPTMLIFQGMVLAFITYSLEAFLLKRIRKSNLELPKFVDFYLPGNAIAASFMLYLLVLFIEIMGINLHTQLIMVNLQLVFNFMFMAQGIAVCIYYFRKWIRQGPNKTLFFAGLILCITGFMGISFVGMLDSIIDFRKVRSYKST